jgi:hypothetical protein
VILGSVGSGVDKSLPPQADKSKENKTSKKTILFIAAPFSVADIVSLNQAGQFIP